MAALPRLLPRARVSTRDFAQALRNCDGAMGFESSLIFSSKRRVSRIPRLLVDSSFPVSMLPLHSAIAAARLKSVLAAQSQSWGWVPQGISMPL